MYKTSDLAKKFHLHPNTIRLYEAEHLIPKPKRKNNGYRVFTDLHVDQLSLLRLAFDVEVLQSGLRKEAVEIVKTSAQGEYDKALQLTKDYEVHLEKELERALAVLQLAKNWQQGKKDHPSGGYYKRKEVSDLLGITMDALRNWEMNGLLKVKRKDNGYRVYDEEDLETLQIILALRRANYSLSAILRMLSSVAENKDVDLQITLDTPSPQEEVVSACDALLTSLKKAKENAKEMEKTLKRMKKKRP